MGRLVDRDAAFFRPLWVRVACIVLPLIWAGVEWWHGNGLWAGLFAAAGIYLGVVLFGPRRP